MSLSDHYILNSNEPLPTTLKAFFWYFVKRQPLAFAVFFLAPAAMILENNIIPYSLKMIVDAITTHQEDRKTIFTTLAPALWLGGGAWLAMITIIRLQNWWQGYVIPRFEGQIRMTVFNYLSQHSYHYFSNQMAGSLANKVNDLPRAIESIRMILSWNMVATFSAILVALILMIFINVWFAALLLAWVVVQVIISLRFARNINRYSEENAEDRSELSGKMVDTLSNISAVKLFAHARREVDYVARSQEQEAKSNKKLIIYMNIFRLFLDIPVTLMLGVMVYLLIVFWQQHMISSGDVVFIFYSVFMIMGQMWFLSHAMADLFREAGIAEQALSLIAAPIEITDASDAVELTITEGRIEFEQVSFHYHQGTRVFENKSILIQPSEKVGLVGHSGGGKTTFTHLILRFFELESGRILIDGQDLSRVTQESLRGSISMIPQDPSLFHRSLLDNIAYARPSASFEEIIAASRQAHCHEFISKLPQGYNTLVGERGIKLSGGQRQRIAIARAILKNAPILILDEATSQLDSLTEQLIQDSLVELMKNKTTLVIAHRLSTLLHMDRILVFDKGHIAEDGSHDELMRQNGLYKAMWDAQVGGFLADSAED